MSHAAALIIDDEPDIRELIAMTLGRIGMETHTAANLAEAHQLLETYDFDVCLTDMRLPDGNGLEFVRHIQDTQPDLPVAVITAHGNMQAAVEAMKSGAFDFVSKPVDITQLRRIVTQAIATPSKAAKDHDSSAASESRLADVNPVDPGPVSLHSLSGKLAASRDDGLVGAERLIGTSEPMQALRRMIVKVARTNAPVWITGESGTGKELIARLIHDNGPRASFPFVAINCGAIPAELMESELFGHVKGSFTGAVANNDGLFRRAEGGTMFLDEVAELPLHMQVKLLRAIQERSVRPVGGSEEVSVDARVLSASHEDLAAAVEVGRFRHDLYYRLNVISIRSPGLRERPGDIAALCASILTRTTTDPCAAPPTLDSEALQKLESYHFPGNVRELENLLERAIAMADEQVIGVDDLVLRSDAASPANLPEGVVERRHKGIEVDRQRFLDTLEASGWNRKLAATQLGLTYRQFRYRLAQLDIKGPGSR